MASASTTAVPGRTLRAVVRRALPPPSKTDLEAGRRPRSRRDWAVDALCLAVAVSFGAIGYLPHYGSPFGDTAATLDLAGGVVMVGGLWWRRRHPVALAILGAVIGTYSLSSAGAGAVMLFSVGVHRDPRWVALVAAIQSPSIFAYAAIWPDEEVPYVWLVVLVHALLGAGMAWGMLVRSRRHLLASLRERAVRAESEQQLRVSQARDLERARIAREMHDVVAHRISLVSLHAGALEFRPDATPEEVARAAGIIRTSAHEALEDLRQVIGVLRDGDSSGPAAAVPGDVRPQPGIRDLPALLRESRDAGMRIQEELALPAEEPAATTGRTAYRVVQEGLTNARKHAWGATVRVRCAGSAAEGLTVEIATPAAVGAGPDVPIPGTGTGLVGLRERVELADGRLEAAPTADGGFLLRARLPWSVA
ncbi:sensor histidine kinase [Patulibacter sp.]|uniref:sensor histidine kinase n=1 Tax=Patulibacter sp. TaxID=1912859 RepID=UPI00272144F0|nr:histidine kinase [Patulibacter sp.]MDO9407935.1 histidine kinase [Patulibacter sp.]